MHFKMSFAVCFNLDQSKILSSGNGLMKYLFCAIFYKLIFRQSSENTVTKFLSKASLKKKDKEVPWKFSKEPIKKALLRKTNLRDDLRKAACRSFADILSQNLRNRVCNKETN